MTRAVGHRGAPYQHRENTLASLRRALACGADAVEFDVRLTRDGVPVLLHDATLKRLWGDDRAVADIKASELRDALGGAVPTLSEALEALISASPAFEAWRVQGTESRHAAEPHSVAAGKRRGGGKPAAGAPPAHPTPLGAPTRTPHLLVDLPGGGVAWREALAAVEAHGAHPHVSFCGAPAPLLRLRAAAPDAEIALTWRTLAPPRPALLAALRPRWLNYQFGLVDRDLVARTHDAGYLVSVWTPDTRRSLARLVSYGVDSITTNRIDLLTALLR